MGGGCGAREVISGRARPASGAWVEVGGGRGGGPHTASLGFSCFHLYILPYMAYSYWSSSDD